MKRNSLSLTLLISLAVIFFGIAGQVRAQGEPFYKGKTITIMIGSTAGGF
ncbi:MAG: hypothetical protein HW419_2936 [Deltaproteobacteria bacterium]|nr:hypothetical protein [Deltaproteobacteria bacterium]